MKSIETLEDHLQRIGVLQLRDGPQRQQYERLRGRVAALLELLREQVDEALRTRLERQADLLMRPFTIFVAGEFSKGKSSLINALCGNEAVRPVSIAPQDFKITVLAHGDPRDNTTSKYVDVRHHPFAFLEFVNLVDSPGINAALRPTHTDITREYVANANLILLVTSADRTVSEEELELVRFISSSNRSEIVFVFNKIDIFEDRLIDFRDTKGLEEMTRRLEEALTSQTDIRDPQIFALSARRAMWAVQHDDEEVWEISQVGPLVAYIGALLAAGRAWKAKLTRPLEYLEGRHVDGEPLVQGLLQRARVRVTELRAARRKVEALDGDIDAHAGDIERAIDAFSVDDIEAEFDRSLDAFVDDISSTEMTRKLRAMRRAEQEKLVQARLAERFEVWERGLAERVETWIRKVVDRFEACWDHCREVVSEDPRLRELVEERRRKGVETTSDPLDYRARNADLLRQIERLAGAVHEEGQRSFRGLVVRQGEALGTAEERLSKAGVGGLALFPLAAVLADVLLTGGALTIGSFLTSLLAGLGTGGVAMWGLNAHVEQLKKQMRDRMSAQKARLVAEVRAQVADHAAGVLRGEAQKFVARCREEFVARLGTSAEVALSTATDEETALERATSEAGRLREEIEALADEIASQPAPREAGVKHVPQPSPLERESAQPSPREVEAAQPSPLEEEAAQPPP